MVDLRHAPARLLVADDNKVNRLLLTRSLELQGHTVQCAENGRIALEMLRRDPFDLLLLDMEMPEMTGFEVLEHLSADVKLQDLPVIVTSSLEGVAEILKQIKQRRVVSFVGYNLQFHPVVKELQKFLADDAVGKPLLFQCQVGAARETLRRQGQIALADVDAEVARRLVRGRDMRRAAAPAAAHLHDLLAAQRRAT